jgi:hypothetical protein
VTVSHARMGSSGRSSPGCQTGPQGGASHVCPNALAGPGLVLSALPRNDAMPGLPSCGVSMIRPGRECGNLREREGAVRASKATLTCSDGYLRRGSPRHCVRRAEQWRTGVGTTVGRTNRNRRACRTVPLPAGKCARRTPAVRWSTAVCATCMGCQRGGLPMSTLPPLF